MPRNNMVHIEVSEEARALLHVLASTERKIQYRIASDMLIAATAPRLEELGIDPQAVLDNMPSTDPDETSDRPYVSGATKVAKRLEYLGQKGGGVKAMANSDAPGHRNTGITTFSERVHYRNYLQAIQTQVIRYYTYILNYAPETQGLHLPRGNFVGM